MVWALFSILGALLYSTVNLFDKYILSRLHIRPTILLVVLAITGLISSGIIFLLRGFDSLSLFHILLAFVGGIFFILMSFFYFEAAKDEEISRVVPLFYLSPLFILVIARLYLQEQLVISQYIGTCFLVIGAIAISNQNIFRLRFGKAFWLMLLASFSLSCNQIITEYLLRYTDFWTIFAYMRIGAGIVLLPQMITYIPELKKLYHKKKTAPFALMGIAEVLNLAAVLSINIAASFGSITLVNALSSVQPLVLLLLVIVVSLWYPKILKEEISRESFIYKMGCIVAMVLGGVLIS